MGSFNILVPALPIYILEVGGSESDVGLVMGVYTISSIIARPFIGREVDGRGKKLFLVIGGMIFVISSLLYNWSTSVPLLVLLRLFQGTGVAVLHTSASALISDVAPMKRRGEAMGIFGTAGNVSTAAAPAVGFAILSYGGFLLLFLSSAALAFASLVVAIFIGTEHSRPNPLQPRSPFLSRKAIFPSLLGLCLGVSYGAVFSFVALHASRQGVGNPGLFFTPYALTLIAVRIAAGKASDVYGRSAVIAPGLIFASASLVVISVANSMETFLLAAVLFGAGFGSVQPAIQALIGDRVGIGQRGAAMATYGAIFDIGIATGSILLGFTLERTGFTPMFLVAACGPLSGLAVLAVHRKRKSHSSA